MKLLRFVTAHDVGTIINPIGHQGQIDGAAMMAIGSSLMEELIDDNGKITTTNLGEYKIPNIADIPKFKTVLIQSKGGPGPSDAKGIGEHANVSPPAAITDAVHSPAVSGYLIFRSRRRRYSTRYETSISESARTINRKKLVRQSRNQNSEYLAQRRKACPATSKGPQRN